MKAQDGVDGALVWRRRQVEQKIGLSTSTLYSLIRAGRFPRGRRVPGAPGVVVWFADEVRAWLDALPEADPHDRPAKGRPAAAVEADVE